MQSSLCRCHVLLAYNFMAMLKAFTTNRVIHSRNFCFIYLNSIVRFICSHVRLWNQGNGRSNLIRAHALYCLLVSRMYQLPATQSKFKVNQCQILNDISFSEGYRQLQYKSLLQELSCFWPVFDMSKVFFLYLISIFMTSSVIGTFSIERKLECSRVLYFEADLCFHQRNLKTF